MRDFVNRTWAMILGDRHYNNHRHWFTSCVMGRLAMGSAAAVLSINLLLRLHDDVPTGIYLFSVLLLLAVNLVFAVCLTWGSYVNYCRLREDLVRRNQEASDA